MANLFDLTISGSGTLGEIVEASVSGASVTPASPADSSSSIGSISVSGRTTTRSHFLMGNRVTIDEMNGLGSMFAIVDSVTVAPAKTTIEGPVQTSRFMTGNIGVPAVLSGSPVGALDLAMELTGNRRALNFYDQGTSNKTVSYTMNGHGAGFTVDHKMVRPVDKTTYKHVMIQLLDYIYPANISVTPPIMLEPYYSAATGKVYAKQINKISGQYGYLLGNPGGGFIDPTTPGEKALFSFYFPTDAGTQDFTTYFGNYEADVSASSMYFNFNPTAHTVTVDFSSMAGGSEDRSIVLDTTSITGPEWLVSTAWTYDKQTLEVGFEIYVSGSDGTNKQHGSFVTHSNPDIPVWQIRSTEQSIPTARMIRIDSIPVAWTGWERPYEIGAGFFSETPNAVTGNVIRNFNGQLWDYLNQVCSGTGTEIAVTDQGFLTLRNIGTKTIDVSEMDSPVLKPTNNKAEKVSLSWAEHTDKLGYSYDVDTVYSVGVNETATAKVQTNLSISWITQPQPQEVVDMMPPYNMMSGYAISGADNLPVSPLQWLDYGGSLKAEPTDIEGEILITMVGPRQEIPGVSAPYKFSASDDKNEYPLISLMTYGSPFGETIVTESLTGASPSATTQIEPVAITNVCATSWDTVWPIIARSVKKYAGPVTTLTFTMPTAHIEAFGLCEGSIFRYGDANYRVTSADYHVATTDITAQQYTTYADVEGEWPGSTYAQVESFWADDSYTYEDVSIAPLTTAW